MSSVQNLSEKRLRNPLRKQSLQGQPTNKNLLDDLLSKLELPPEESEKLQNLQNAQVDPSFIQKFRDSKLSSLEKDLRSSHLRTTVDPSRYSKILEYQGIQVFQDKQNLTFDISKDLRKIGLIRYSLTVMVRDLQGLVPIRKPRFIITDIKKELKGKSILKTGKDDVAPAFYSDRIIYVDINSIDEPYYFIHEYGHYIVDLIPKQTEKILMKEYEGMLDNYFRSIKQKKRSNLEPKSEDLKSVEEAEAWRKRISKKLGLPSEYSATNFDEFWTEIISNWYKMPNNKNTYRFKTMAKKVMTRLN